MTDRGAAATVGALLQEGGARPEASRGAAVSPIRRGKRGRAVGALARLRARTHCSGAGRRRGSDRVTRRPRRRAGEESVVRLTVHPPQRALALALALALAPVGAAAQTGPVAPAALGPASPSPSPPADRYQRLDAYVAARVAAGKTPGVAVVVVEGDEVTFSRGYGLADRETGRPMTDETPVAIASTNKGMTALAVLQLVEQGRVTLDAPVTRYLPAFAMDDDRAGAITLRQLLSHTAGLAGGAV